MGLDLGVALGWGRMFEGEWGGKGVRGEKRSHPRSSSKSPDRRGVGLHLQ